jgi:hypothetical protein
MNTPRARWAYYSMTYSATRLGADSVQIPVGILTAKQAVRRAHQTAFSKWRQELYRSEKSSNRKFLAAKPNLI